MTENIRADGTESRSDACTSRRTGKRAVALGIFDGVHNGHRRIIYSALGYKAMGLDPAVFTFNVESVGSKHGKKYEFIFDETQKHRILKKMGVEYIYAPREEELRSMSGEEFAEKILRGKLNAGAVVCGENFRFGAKAACGTEDLRRFGEKYGFEVNVMNLLKTDERIVSSETVREFLLDGRVSELRDFWGMDYFLDSVVKEGNHIGTTLKFPTANQHFAEGQLVPKKGVYGSVTEIDGVMYDSVTNIGERPTVNDGAKPLAETNILDFSGNLYGREITVTLLYFIREEKKFSSFEELKKQVGTDAESVRASRQERIDINWLGK